MAPAIPPGSRLLIVRSSLDRLRENDIVMVHSGETLLVHRLHRRHGALWLRGDASAGWDGPLSAFDLVGRVESIEAPPKPRVGVNALLGGLRRRYRAVERALRSEWAVQVAPRDTLRFATLQQYSSDVRYAPGGRFYARGAFAWEKAILEHPAFPRSGDVLVGGAGGGRELAFLAERGLRAVGFDPSPELVRAARTHGHTVSAGGYEEFVSGRLELSPLPYVAVWFGWASYSHLLDRDLRLRSLVEARRRWPNAVLVLSYLSVSDGPFVAATRSWLRRARGIPADLRFTKGAGFWLETTTAEIRLLAERAGYEVVLEESDGYPHALLVPKVTVSASEAPAR